MTPAENLAYVQLALNLLAARFVHTGFVFSAQRGVSAGFTAISLQNTSRDWMLVDFAANK